MADEYATLKKSTEKREFQKRYFDEAMTLGQTPGGSDLIKMLGYIYSQGILFYFTVDYLFFFVLFNRLFYNFLKNFQFAQKQHNI